MLSSLIPVYQGKGDPLNTNSYRGIKLLEHASKLYKRVLDIRFREIVDIDKMQYGLMPVSRTVEAVFILRTLTNYQSKSKKLFYVLVDLEKAFDRVLRKVIWYALRKSTWFRVSCYYTEVVKLLFLKMASCLISFLSTLGVYQGSVLNPLLPSLWML